MDQGVTFTVSINLKPDKADYFCHELLPQLLRQTNAFAGVRSARAVRQEAQPTRVMFIDVFDSVEASDAYMAWRGGRGDLDMLASFLTEPPVIDVWPIPIAIQTEEEALSVADRK